MTQTVMVTFSAVRANNGDQHVKGFSLGAFKVDTCTGAEHFATSGFKATAQPKARKGKFKFTQTVAGKTLQVTGRFTKKTEAKGAVTFTASKTGNTCTTGKLNWGAKLK